MNNETEGSGHNFLVETLSNGKALIPHRARIEMDGVSAAWLLFQFSRNSKEDCASHTIRTVLPNGDLNVVNIEVKYLEDRKSAEDNKSPKGLPGAFAQDIFISLVDSLVNQVKSDHSELITKARTIGLNGINIPPNCTEVYFRNKDLAKRMGMTEKNSKITQALKHLHQTHITIRGCIYHNGKEQAIQHDAYYLSSLTTGKIIRKGTDRSEWNRAKFDEVIVRQILQGYIAQLDTEKLLQLPSGAPRKLYTLFSAKLLERQGNGTVIISKDELLSTLRIKKQYFKELTKKYFQALIDAKIITEYTFVTHKGIEVVAFTACSEEKNKLPTHPSSVVDDYFKLLSEVAKTDSTLATVLENKKIFDLDTGNLEILIKKNNKNENFNNKVYPLVILLVDMVIHNICQGQYIKTVLGLVKSLLKKQEMPDLKPGFLPIEERYKRILARKEAAKVVEKAHASTVVQDMKVVEVAQQAWSVYSDAQKKRLIQAIEEKIFPNGQKSAGGWQPAFNFYDLRAVEILESAINHGMPTGDVNSLIKWYKLKK